MNAAEQRGIVHHATLPHRGGAVRVARLLACGQRLAGCDARLSFEVAENDPEPLDGAASQMSSLNQAAHESALPLLGPTQPEALGRALADLPTRPEAHLHTSINWPALLAGLLAEPPAEPRGDNARRVLLTLHDATPLTGGCAYPLDCPHFPRCADPCPRNFPAAQARQAETAALLERLAPVLISPSRWLAGLARLALPQLPVRVVPNGVPWPELSALPSRAQARAALGIAPGARVALFAAHGGARAAYKSGPDWGQYWERLRTCLPLASAQVLAFAVGGDEASSHGGLTVWPYLDRGRLSLLLRAANALIYPTLADNHPLVLLEAAAHELPVVSYAVGGVPEIVLHGETGLLTPPGDPSAFCRAAGSLLADAGLCRSLGRAARAHGGKRFHTARMLADYAALP